jgi:hypothetical protein
LGDEGPKRARLRIDPSDLALEILSIVIAIVLATAVGGLVDRNRAGARTHEALSQICQEISQDDARLRAVHPLHVRIGAAFARSLQGARGEQLEYDRFAQTFQGAAPRGFQPLFGTTTAWELARSSDALAGVPYALRATLVNRYGQLAVLKDENNLVLASVLTAPTERHPNFFFVAASLEDTLNDVSYAEVQLGRDDAAAVAALRSAADC